jgi:hypothetical protein
VSAPTVRVVSDRALVLYAFVRRATIEHVLGEIGDEPIRIRQAEVARSETTRWLEREDVATAVDDEERFLLEAVSGAWPRDAILDGMWRKEALGALLWSLRHIERMPPIDDEFEVSVLNERIERYGSVASFRENGSLRGPEEIDAAWREADAWLAATEGRDGADATLASISAERSRALGWVLDDARPLP